MTDKESLLAWQHDCLVPTYSADLVLSRGEGSRVWDIDNRNYLDFTSGISVCNLGHCHPKVTQAIHEQSAKLVHVSNLFVNEKQPALASALSKASFGGRCFFANSGAEANEALIKFARQWGRSRERHEIICMHHSFHGRTISTLSATDKPAIREGFGPLTPGFCFVDFNDLDALDQAITEETAAILMEPVQGEGGLIVPENNYLKGVRELCDKYDILLLFDEVQTGIGRTGELFAYQSYDVIPDAMSLAKALGNGFPIGALMVHPDHADVLGPGSHASTFGGTPLACAAALAVIETIESEEVLKNTREQGSYLKAALDDICAASELVKEVRGIGLMLGMQFNGSPNDFVSACRDRGLLILTAGENVARIYPPLTVSRSELDEALAIMKDSLTALEKGK